MILLDPKPYLLTRVGIYTEKIKSNKNHSNMIFLLINKNYKENNIKILPGLKALCFKQKEKNQMIPISEVSLL